MSAKFDAAFTATNAIIERMLFVQEKLGDAMVNGHGILADASELRSRMVASRAALAQALEAISATDWPSLIDYQAAED